MNLNSVQQLLMQGLVGAEPKRFNDATVSIDAVKQTVGQGQHDLVSGGTFSDLAADHLYTIKITTDGTTFQWKKDDGAYNGSDITITGSAQTLSEGVSVTFGHTSGYTPDDVFTIKAHAGVLLSANSLVNIDVNDKGTNADLVIYNGNGTDGDVLYHGTTALWNNGDNIVRRYSVNNLYVVLTADSMPDIIVGYN